MLWILGAVGIFALYKWLDRDKNPPKGGLPTTPTTPGPGGPSTTNPTIPTTPTTPTTPTLPPWTTVPTNPPTTTLPPSEGGAGTDTSPKGGQRGTK